jgi:HlyD family secretion protein/adhesin transport system membrane fusion protein
LTLPFALEEGRVPGIVSRLLYVASIVIGAFIVWASVAEIRELTIAAGQLRPVGSVHLVQHLEGGIVSEILVSDGDVVEAGTALLRLQPIAAASDLAQLTVRAASLALQVEQQTAALEGRDPDFGALAQQYPDLARHRMNLHASERDRLAQQRRSLASRVVQKFSEVQALQARLESLEAQLAIDREDLDMRQQLFDQRLLSRTHLLDAKREYESTNDDMIAVRGQLHSVQEANNEASINLLALDDEFANRLNDERSRAAAELAELGEALAKQQDRVDRLLVRAPASGVVTGLAPKSIGEVIGPGDVVAEIVPMDSEIVAEVQIDPADIGHVSIGDVAEVKVTTFDFARFGAIEGTVRQISATTFRNEDGEPYYRAVIALASDHVGSGANLHPVLPGMVVNAEIVTGSKSFMRYLLKPIYRSLDVAFSER